MTRRTVIALGLALVFGVAAAMGVRSMSQARTRSVDTVPVVVAAVDMHRGKRVTQEVLYTKDWPKSLVPPGAFTSVEEAKDRVLRSPVVKDEPLIRSKLTEPGDSGGLGPMIGKGMRAYTIRTPDAASGVAGFIVPDSYVDVMLTVTDRNITAKAGGGTTVTLLQNMKVLAVNEIVDIPTENRVEGDSLRCVTLEVTPEEAQKLSLAQTKGTLHLSLRNTEDKDAADTYPMTMKELQYMEDQDAFQTPVAKRRRMEPIRIMTYRGNSASWVTVQPSLPATAPPDDIASADTPDAQPGGVQ